MVEGFSIASLRAGTAGPTSVIRASETDFGVPLERGGGPMGERGFARRFRSRLGESIYWLAGALTLIAGGMTASEVKALFDYLIKKYFKYEELNTHIISLFFYAGLFALFVYVLHRLRGNPFRPRTRLRQNERPPK